MKRLLCLFLCAALLACPLFSLTGCGRVDREAAVPVVIDTDPGIDDAFALLIAASSDRLDIRGITAVHGNVPVGKTALNALKLAAFFGVDCPVAVGAEAALDGSMATMENVHGANGLGNVALPVPAKGFDSRSAVELLHSAAQEAGGALQVLALGPLTNIAAWLTAYPDDAALIAGVTLMGGSRGKGNMSRYGEFNIYADPQAANIVFDSGLAITMADLEATQYAYLKTDELRALAGEENPCAQLIGGLCDFLEQKGAEDGGKTLHDALAAACLIDPSLAGAVRARVTVDPQADARHRGQTVVEEDENGNVTILDKPDTARFTEFLRGCVERYEAAPPTDSASLPGGEESLFLSLPWLLTSADKAAESVVRVSDQPLGFALADGSAGVIDTLIQFTSTGEIAALAELPEDTASPVLILRQEDRAYTLYPVSHPWVPGSTGRHYVLYRELELALRTEFEDIDPKLLWPDFQPAAALNLEEAFQLDCGGCLTACAPLSAAGTGVFCRPETDTKPLQAVVLREDRSRFYLVTPDEDRHFSGLVANGSDGRSYEVFSLPFQQNPGDGGPVSVDFCLVPDLPKGVKVISLDYEGTVSHHRQNRVALDLTTLPQTVVVDGIALTLTGLSQGSGLVFTEDGSMNHPFHMVEYAPRVPEGYLTEVRATREDLTASLGWGSIPNHLFIPYSTGLDDSLDNERFFAAVDLTLFFSEPGILAF
ncbi:nucleoside hydrolase [Anaerofilum sp. BX8]|uniref:Nucleoside hydrolase n=1 Tax=Anaerofilum hominis TaxID=2763016 RepID=A0A923I9B0_9FIRM|nr:nucleoside hydrolase [Anaerofilum hominis]MBC5581474.1 nucleoside hydrolase [Anaerofilum hominis]